MTEETELSPKAKRIILIVVGILLIPASIGFFLEMTGVDVNGYLNEKLGTNQVTADTNLSLENDEEMEPYAEKADIPADFNNKTLYNWMY